MTATLVDIFLTKLHTRADELEASYRNIQRIAELVRGEGSEIAADQLESIAGAYRIAAEGLQAIVKSLRVEQEA